MADIFKGLILIGAFIKYVYYVLSSNTPLAHHLQFMVTLLRAANIS